MPIYKHGPALDQYGFSVGNGLLAPNIIEIKFIARIPRDEAYSVGGDVCLIGRKLRLFNKCGS